jgi:hypothetical protein
MGVSQKDCGNLIHRCSNVPVRFCKECGEVVNEEVSAKACSEEEHERKRLDRATYCSECGQPLAGGA